MFSVRSAARGARITTAVAVAEVFYGGGGKGMKVLKEKPFA